MSKRRHEHIRRDPLPGLRQAVGEVVREMRLEAPGGRISQENLSIQSNVSRSYVSYVECGLRNVTLDVLFAFCEACGMEPEEAVRRIKERRKRLA